MDIVDGTSATKYNLTGYPLNVEEACAVHINDTHFIMTGGQQWDWRVGRYTILDKANIYEIADGSVTLVASKKCL